MNKWKKIKQFINSKEIGTIINISEIRQCITDPHKYSPTPFRYSNMLRRLGILTDFGYLTCKISSHIRKDATYKEFSNAHKGINSDWRGWFINVKA